MLAIANAGVLPAPQAYIATNTIHTAPATHVEYHTPAITYHEPQYTLHTPAIGTSHKSITRTLDGTISQYSKAVDTAFSSVRKADTRISNKVYQPAATTLNYVHHEPIQYHHAIGTTTATKTAYLNAPQAHIAYSPATLVSHVEYDAPLVHYEW